MRVAKIGSVDVSRLVVGGNPVSGFSHQSPERDQEMRGYFTDERVFELLRSAEDQGINTAFMRTDDHIHGLIKAYWDSGGTIQWFAQVVYSTDDYTLHKEWIKRAGDLGASGMYLHGGATDFWHANGLHDLFHEALECMREYGPGGFAGHSPVTLEWVGKEVKPDFEMCCHYNPSDRTKDPTHTNVDEKWHPDDRAKMLKVVEGLDCPAAHYKVFAGGNRPIIEAFETLSKCVRENDVVCIGVYPGDDPNMLATDIKLFEEYVERVPATV